MTAERIRVLDAEIARLTEERERLSHSLSVLTEGGHSVNTNGNMTPSSRRNVAIGKREHVNTAAKDFAATISKPHAGGPGYSIRSLSNELVKAGFSASRGTFTAVFKGRFRISRELEKRVFEMTGYRFPAKYVREE